MRVEYLETDPGQPEPASPRSLRRVLGTPLVVDILLVVATTLLSVVGVGVEMGATHQRLPWQVGGYALAVLAALTLLLRRRSPIGTVLAIVIVSALYHVFGYPGLAPATAMFVGFYVLAAYGPNRRSLLIGVCLVVVVNTVSLLPPHPVSFAVATILGPAVGMLAAGAAGHAIRSRRMTTEEQLRNMRQANLDDIRQRITKERLFIARELHDVIGHTVTVISVQAAVGTDMLDHRPDATRTALAAIRDAAKEAMTELRSTLQVLRDTSDTPQAPQPHLDQLPALVELAKASGVRTSLVIEGEARHVPTAVGIAAYRIVQESLTNIARYAPDGCAIVRLDYRPEALVVEVIDDSGSPSPVPAGERTHGSGHGLIGMREQARAVGGFIETGSMSVTSGGFAVRGWLPTGEDG
ncbi:MAG TPA: histidine kinase [Pseudonocardiaceae bacterium]